MEQLKACYTAYLAAVEKAEKNKSTWNGAFGLGTSTKDHPCHDNFYEAMEAWCETFLGKKPSRSEAEEAVRYLSDGLLKGMSTLLNVMFGEEDYPIAATQNRDVNKDGKLDTDDAVYLLLHVMFGEEDYPI